MSAKPPIDPADMKANQKAMGVDSFEVKDPTLAMKVTQMDTVGKATNDVMTSSAPNLPFKLFGLEKFFKKKDA